ncbi:zf-HC2 domain-containing protein [bacterium]|nr:zf-HC2 domain-containing protein [bacterium]
MISDECKKVTSMLLAYIEHKLSDEDRLFVENHFKSCSDCYTKYLEMKEIVKNLHFEYQKLLNEFEKIEASQVFNIREYETFYNNISPYIDDELSYDDSIQFRKYLLKSKPARTELANAYNLKNNIRHSTAMFKESLNVNFSKDIIKQLKTENRYTFDAVYRRAAVIIGIMLTTLIIISFLVGYSYVSDAVAKTDKVSNNIEQIVFPPSDDLVEFTFDHGPVAMLIYK